MNLENYTLKKCSEIYELILLFELLILLHIKSLLNAFLPFLEYGNAIFWHVWNIYRSMLVCQISRPIPAFRVYDLIKISTFPIMYVGTAQTSFSRVFQEILC